jgi:hypothetical protein
MDSLNEHGGAQPALPRGLDFARRATNWQATATAPSYAESKAPRSVTNCFPVTLFLERAILPPKFWAQEPLRKDRRRRQTLVLAKEA